MQEKRTCSSCDAPVYATDDVCVSCGADLRTVAPSAKELAGEAGTPPGQPGPAGPETASSHALRPRPTIVKPWYHAPVEMCGRLWDIYPWIGVVIYVVGGVFFAPGMPDALRILVLIVSALWHSLFLFWLIVDVLYFGVDWWWVPVAFFLCYPIGLLVYLWKGR